MRSQILFQMDHCPAMFDNCHRYQGMTGPLKMAKQNSTKYRAVVEVTKLLLIPCHLIALCKQNSYKVRIRFTIVGGEFMQHFLPALVIRRDVFMRTASCQWGKCIGGGSQQMNHLLCRHHGIEFCKRVMSQRAGGGCEVVSAERWYSDWVGWFVLLLNSFRLCFSSFSLQNSNVLNFLAWRTFNCRMVSKHPSVL